ncbi:MAG TPA: PilZ domain-containing protein [Steroidobacteraceae bacterium]|nr:PilZ domain-containing protein [Steroidobacteraceae bacterium]
MKASGIQTSTTWSTWHLAAIRAAEAAAPVDPRMEHRWGQRRNCLARVRVSAGSGVGGSARLRNVSLSGAFLETALPLPLFSQIAIAVVSADGSTDAVEFTASVVRADAGGVGIEWCEPVSGSICRQLGCTRKCAAAPLP